MTANDETDQLRKFRRAAQDADADESEEHFKERLRKIAKAKVTSEPLPEPPAGKEADDEKLIDG